MEDMDKDFLEVVIKDLRHINNTCVSPDIRKATYDIIENIKSYVSKNDRPGSKLFLGRIYHELIPSKLSIEVWNGETRMYKGSAGDLNNTILHNGKVGQTLCAEYADHFDVEGDCLKIYLKGGE